MENKNGLVDFGLLFLRIGIGAMFIFHGLPKLLQGPETWESVGSAMGLVGVHFWPVFWGFCAACAEAIGGAFLIMGFMSRYTCAFMAFTMFVAALSHLSGTGPLMAKMMVASHPVEDCIVFLALIITGPGSFSADSILHIGKK